MAALVAAGGKRLRPALVLLAAKLGRYDLQKLAEPAIAVELTHAATLVHDDVIDRAELRRGRPTVAMSQGNDSAIVIGDYYLVKAYELAARSGSPAVVSTLARAVMEICAGEVRQQSMRYVYALGEDDYLQWIHDKTAGLLAACCDIGGLLGEVGEDAKLALHRYGIHLGFAFQIADDVLDYTATEDEIGKPIGHDLLEGFATLPVMLALRTGAVGRLEDGRRLAPDEARAIAERIRNSEAPSMALERAREFASKARDELAVLPDGEVSRTLAALTEYVVSRTF
jgi:heptaprenyl diphosphate synthase